MKIFLKEFGLLFVTVLFFSNSYSQLSEESLIEMKQNIEKCSFNIPQLLPNNSQCSQQRPTCANGIVGAINESVLPEVFEALKEISPIIQFIQAEDGFYTLGGLPFSGRGIMQYGRMKGSSSSPPAGTIYFIDGKCSFYTCELTSSAIEVYGKNYLTFILTKDKGLVYMQGEGSVTINNVLTTLPIVKKAVK